jgi:hypothetical protein
MQLNLKLAIDHDVTDCVAPPISESMAEIAAVSSTAEREKQGDNQGS